jgi:hypothetical protein
LLPEPKTRRLLSTVDVRKHLVKRDVKLALSPSV